YWSLSAYAKRRGKNAVSFIGKIEAAVAHYAERYHVGAGLCGPIHSPAIRGVGKGKNYNCGDWVEGCSALFEGGDRNISRVNYDPFVASHSAANRSLDSLQRKERMLASPSS